MLPGWLVQPVADNRSQFLSCSIPEPLYEVDAAIREPGSPRTGLRPWSGACGGLAQNPDRPHQLGNCRTHTSARRHGRVREGNQAEAWAERVLYSNSMRMRQ